MDWMRENKTLAGIIGVMVAGGLGLTAWLVMSYMAYATSVEEYQAVSGNVASIKGAKLFPSAENVEAKEAAVSAYEEAVGRLGTVLLTLQQPVAPLTDTEFQARLKSRIADARQAAAATKMALPKEFAFGFDSYTTGLPRSGEAATQLGDYLAAVDAIVKMIIESGAKSIDSLERTELAIEKGTPPPPAPPKEPKKVTKARTTKGKGKAAAKAVVAPKEIAQVVERRKLTLTLTADQGPLQVIMNKLASPSKMVHFSVVRQLRVENEKQEGPLRGSLKRLESNSISEPSPGGDNPTQKQDETTNKAPGAGTAAVGPQVIEPAKPSDPDAQAVFGEELLKVYLEIDLVRFLEPKSEAADAAK